MIFRPLQLKDLKNDVLRLQGEEENVPELVELLLSKGLELGASDLHLEAKKPGLVCKYRIDGVLHPVVTIRPELQENLLFKLKNLAAVMSYKKRIPQDGAMQLEKDGEKIMLRAAFLPTLHGEKVVIRFPDKQRLQFDITTLGLSKVHQAKVLQLVRPLQGTLLLTGPSSSGKTTTIYTLLRYLFQVFGEQINICTIEDPIEADLEEINQSQLDEAGGLTYARALKAILRQDPNVIVLGEIRDAETARIAVEAGLSGHLVISTVHCGDAVGVFSRLLNMKIEPFLVASSVSGVMAQRLVRQLCANCAEEYLPEAKERKLLGIGEHEEARFRRAVGCPACHFTGYLGRKGIFELLEVSEPIRELVMQQLPTAELHTHAQRQGMKHLLDDACSKVREGLTTVEEIVRLGILREETASETTTPVPADDFITGGMEQGSR